MSRRKTRDAENQAEPRLELPNDALNKVALVLAVLAVRLGPVRNHANKQKAVFLKSLGFQL